MSKRIGFMISTFHLIAHGGLGQFTKGFSEMAADFGWIVDLIVDNKEKPKLTLPNVNIITPTKPYKYKKHYSLFKNKESYNLEKMANFRDSLNIALKTNTYDLIICNSHESYTGAYSLGIQDKIPVLFYTHDESLFFKTTANYSAYNDVFNISFKNFFNQAFKYPDIKIGTQCYRNQQELLTSGHNGVYVLPMPMPERDLLEPNLGKKNGVLFIGRYEERKNPEEYFRVIKETKLPAVILTNKADTSKFEHKLQEIGCEDYTIAGSVTGKTKCNIIKHSRVFYMPALRECYPFSFLECFGHMPSVVLEENEWYKNFDSNYFYKCNKHNVCETISYLYETYPTGQNWQVYNQPIDEVKRLDILSKTTWYNFLLN